MIYKNIYRSDQLYFVSWNAIIKSVASKTAKYRAASNSKRYILIKKGLKNTIKVTRKISEIRTKNCSAGFLFRISSNTIEKTTKINGEKIGKLTMSIISMSEQRKSDALFIVCKLLIDIEHIAAK
jgi:hypothetical protein